ncbi:MAG: cytochrome c peroxidase [Cyanobacteriota bacterium]|mgnify:CR=1 FL=1
MKKIISFSLVFLFVLGCKNQEISTLEDNESFLSDLSEVKSVIKKSHKTTFQLKKEADDLRELYSKPKEQWPTPKIDYAHGGTFKEIGSLPLTVKFPNDNQFSLQRAELGKALFFDNKLSLDKNMSCFTCHDSQKNWTDGKQQAEGHNGVILKRNSPTVVNSAHLPLLFWDGRAKSLEEQASAVITNPNELASNPQLIEERLNASSFYKEKFKQAYNIDKIDINYVAKAIATYERTIITKNQSPFDKFVSGQKTALTDGSIRGMHVFRTLGKCINCHNGPNFTDDKFHNLTLTYEQTDKEDLGLYYITKNLEDWGKFKTPSLRNVKDTGPYMHNGVFIPLKKVLELYNDGMNGKDSHRSPLIRSLSLEDQEIADLEEFLGSLSEPVPQVKN